MPIRRTALFLLTGLMVAGCDTGTDEDEQATPSRLVLTAPVETGDAVDRLELLGDVHGEVEIQVFSHVPERIRQLHVEEGQSVATGDPIATLEADLTTSDVAQAGAAVDVAAATRDRLDAELRRLRPLVARGAIAAAQVESLEANLRAAEAQVAQLRAARGAARERRARTVVRAPADGVVALLSVSEGDVAVPQVPLATVVRMDRVKILLRVVEADYVQLREGMQVTVSAPVLPDVERTGTVVQLSPVLDRMTRTAPMEVLVENPDHVLRPGMVAEVAVEIGRRDDVRMTPARAVVMTPRTELDQTAAVFVVDDGVARRREVRIGRRYEARIVIEEGLEVGEEVVVRGQHLLRDGTPVRTEPFREPEPGSA